MQIDPNRQPLIDNRKETHMMVELKMLKAMADGAMTMAAQAEQMAIFAAGMVEGAKQMAESMQNIVEDCARQLAEKRAAKNGGMTADCKAASDSTAPETVANNSSQHAPTLPREAASGAFQPGSGQTGRPESGSRPAPSQGAVGTSPAAQTPPIDIVTLRAFVAERSTPENRAKIKAILGKYGVRKLTELKETQYEAIKN